MRRSAYADLTRDAILDEREQEKQSSRWGEGQITGSGRTVGDPEIIPSPRNRLA
jgi:hypothetical protein